MLNKHCQKFLSFLSTKEPTLVNGIFTYEWIEDNFHETRESIYRMVRYLEAEGYVSSVSVGSSPVGIILEEKGKYYRQFYWAEMKDSFLKSIFLPVLVALLTYIATEFAGNICSNIINLTVNHENTTEITAETNTASNNQSTISTIAGNAK